MRGNSPHLCVTSDSLVALLCYSDVARSERANGLAMIALKGTDGAAFHLQMSPLDSRSEALYNFRKLVVLIYPEILKPFKPTDLG